MLSVMISLLPVMNELSKSHLVGVLIRSSCGTTCIGLCSPQEAEPEKEPECNSLF